MSGEKDDDDLIAEGHGSGSEPEGFIDFTVLRALLGGQDETLNVSDAFDTTQPFTIYLPAPDMPGAPELLRMEVNGQTLDLLSRSLLLGVMHDLLKDADYSALVRKFFGTVGEAETLAAVEQSGFFHQMAGETRKAFADYLGGMMTEMVSIMMRSAAAHALSRIMSPSAHSDYCDALLASLFFQLDERVSDLRETVKRTLRARAG